VNNGYLIMKCSSCQSIMQLAIGGVRSNVFQCPVCLESEIECEAERRGIQEDKGVMDGIRNFTSYVAIPGKDSAN